MSSAQFPDGHEELLRHAFSGEVARFTKDALDRGAESVKVYTEPHGFEGDLRRCTLCGGLPEDEVHGLQSTQISG